MLRLSAFWKVIVLFAAVAGICAGSVTAQEPESRAAVIAAEQAAKAGKLVPYTPSGAERFTMEVRRRLLEAPSGFYPWLGSVYSGGGFTLGAGYRHYYGDRTRWDIGGMYSAKNYKLIDLSTSSLGHARGRVDLFGRIGWRDATQVAYYGLGIDSPDLQSNFRMQQAYGGGNLAVRPIPWVVFGAGLSYEDYTLEEGQGTQPSIEEIHTPATAPGLGASPTFVYTSASAGIDWRPSPGYARRGGLYEVSYHNYADRDSTYSFDRMDGEVVQHVPILRENWVISLHGNVQSILDDQDIVPYFLLPSLGSGSTLRAYSSWRFRDRQSLLLSGEWRWIPNRLAIDMALFYDTGVVAERFRQLSLKDRKSNVGIGIRFHGPFTTPLRIELAHGSEGLHLVFAGSAAF
jgi:hypothetical protein